MTATTFSELEAATLTALWDNELEWWSLLLALADRFIDDGDEDGGRFIQWLWRWGQRPANYIYSTTTKGWWWWTYPNGSSEWNTIVDKRWVTYQDGVTIPTALLPPPFMPVCSNRKMTDYHSLTEAIEAALNCWRTFGEEQKQELERDWRRPQ